MNRRTFVHHSLLLATLATGGVDAALGAPTELDQPGAEVPREEPDSSLLQPLLPAYSAILLERDPDVEGWGPLRLSPSGRYLFAEVRMGDRQSVMILDGEAKLLRDLSHDLSPLVSAAWGASDQQLLLECREKADARPKYFVHNPVKGITSAAVRGGLPEWAAGGKDYLLALATAERTPGRQDVPSGFQRYTAAHDPIGRPLTAERPAWSGDGQSLAYATSVVKDQPEALAELQEVRVLPARGEVPRVVMSHGGWNRLAKEQGWQQASGPDCLTWSPEGDALYGICTARTEVEGQQFLIRMDVRAPRRQILAVPAGTEIISASANARHWLVRLGSRLYRLDFKVASSKKRSANLSTVLR